MPGDAGGSSPYDLAMGLFDDIGDFVSDVADVAVDVVETVGEPFVEAVEAVGSAAGEGMEGFASATGWLGGGLGDAIDFVATTADDLSGGTLSWGLNLADDVVFDNVDYLTGGVVDFDFDDGTFGASVGIEGVMQYGASVGEHGVTAGYDTLVAGGDVGLTDQGFGISGSAGIDFGPFPHVDGHIDLNANGDVSIGGSAQGTIPTPIGFVSGDVEGGFSRTEDGAWAGNVSLDGQLTLPSGTYVGGSLDVAHQQTADGDSITSVGAGGRVGQYGVGEVGVDGKYTHAEVDGVTYDGVEGSAHASGYGFEAGVEGSYDRLETADGDVFEQGSVGGHVSGYGQGIEGSVDYKGATVDGQSTSDWSADGSINFDGEKLAGLGQTLFGESAGGLAGGLGLPDSADALVGMLGSGGTADLLGQLGGDQLAGFVNSLGAQGAADFANKLAADGNFGSLIGSGSDAVQSLLGKVAESGGLGDVLGQLDPGTTANLIGTLAAPPAPPTGITPAVETAVDDALGVATQAATDLATGVITPEVANAEMMDATAAVAAAAPVGELVTADITATTTVDAAGVTVDATANVLVEPAPVEPVDEFSQQIAAAEQVESSVDDLFEGL